MWDERTHPFLNFNGCTVFFSVIAWIIENRDVSVALALSAADIAGVAGANGEKGTLEEDIKNWSVSTNLDIIEVNFMWDKNLFLSHIASEKKSKQEHKNIWNCNYYLGSVLP